MILAQKQLEKEAKAKEMEERENDPELLRKKELREERKKRREERAQRRERDEAILYDSD